MWKQINLSDALRAFLAGRTVKIVDVEVGSIENLQEALQSFFEGAVFLAEEEEEADKAPAIVPPVTITVTGLPEPDPALFESAKPAEKPEPPKVTRAKKQFDEAEKAYQSRKISDIGKLRSLRAAGWDVEKIATEFGCSGQTVRNTMKREGIE